MKLLNQLAPWVLTIGLVIGSLFVMQGAWIHVKALTGQWLIENAWLKTERDGRNYKPWPWADFYPVAQLNMPSIGESLFVLNTPSGQALAFGPAMTVHVDEETGKQIFLIQAHNDTHFKYLPLLEKGASLHLQSLEYEKDFSVQHTKHVDSPVLQLNHALERDRLILSTCDEDDSESRRYLVFGV